MNVTVFKGLQLPAETKRIGHKLEPKDAMTAATNAAQKPDGILKAQNKNIPRFDSASQ